MCVESELLNFLKKHIISWIIKVHTHRKEDSGHFRSISYLSVSVIWPVIIS